MRSIPKLPANSGAAQGVTWSSSLSNTELLFIARTLLASGEELSSTPAIHPPPYPLQENLARFLKKHIHIWCPPKFPVNPSNNPFPRIKAVDHEWVSSEILMPERFCLDTNIFMLLFGGEHSEEITVLFCSPKLAHPHTSQGVGPDINVRVIIDASVKKKPLYPGSLGEEQGTEKHVRVKWQNCRWMMLIL